MVILLPIRDYLPAFQQAGSNQSFRHMTVEAAVRWKDYAASWIVTTINSNLGFDTVPGFTEPLDGTYDGWYHSEMITLGLERRILSALQLILNQRRVEVTDRIHISVLDNALELYIPYSAALRPG